MPIDAGGQRLLRTGQLAQWLADRGHEVVFFTGTMDHYARRVRSTESTIYDVGPGYRIVTLAGRCYARSVSIDRFMNHVDVARSFRAMAPSLAEPDVVLSSYPTEELCRALLDYCEPRRIPVAIDVRDFWPDIFAELVPAPLRLVAPLVFWPLERRACATLARASALSGMTEAALRWAQAKAGRPPVATDFWFPFSYSRLDNSGWQPHDGDLRLSFFGTFSHRSNLDVVIDALSILRGRGVRATLNMCGSGEAEEVLRARAKDNPDVKFHGWLAAKELASLMRQSDLGVLPYDRPDFHKSIPNKFVEYIAGGLGVVSCTDGEVRRMIEDTRCPGQCKAGSYHQALQRLRHPRARRRSS